jgi:hypothetical protein
MQRIGRVDRRMNPEVEKRSSPTTPRSPSIARQSELLELPAAR